MTVVVAMQESPDSLLIGADGEATDTKKELKCSVNKLGTIEGQPVAWGFSGVPGMAIDFNNWFQDNWRKDINWRDFKNEAGREFNRIHKQALTDYGEHVSPDLLSAFCLLVGWRNNIPGIWEFSQGPPCPYDGFHAIGCGNYIAITAKRVIDLLKKEPSVESMRLILDAVIGVKTECGEPKIIWRVTAKGVDKSPPEMEAMNDGKANT